MHSNKGCVNWAFRRVHKPIPLSSSPTHLDGLPLLVALLPALDEDVEAEDEQHARHQRDGHRDDPQPPRRRLVQRAAGWEGANSTLLAHVPKNFSENKEHP